MLFQELGADPDIRSQYVLYRRELIGQVAVQVVGVAADGDGQHIIASAKRSGERDLGVRRDFFADLLNVPGRHAEPKHGADPVTEPLRQ